MFLFIIIISPRFDDFTVHIFQILKRVCSPVPLIHLIFSKLTRNLCHASITTQLQKVIHISQLFFSSTSIQYSLVFSSLSWRINLNNDFFGHKLIFFFIQLLLTWRSTWLSSWKLLSWIGTFVLLQCRKDFNVIYPGYPNFLLFILTVPFPKISKRRNTAIKNGIFI